MAQMQTMLLLVNIVSKGWLLIDYTMAQKCVCVSQKFAAKTNQCLY